MKDERCDLLCVDAPKAEAIRGRLLEGEAALEAAERALSDPTRLLLAAALREGEELCVCVIVFERECCPFFLFELVFEPGSGPIRLRVRGRRG